MTPCNTQDFILSELKKIEEGGNLRRLPHLIHQGKYVTIPDRATGNTSRRLLLNVSSNDYLGLASDPQLRDDFFKMLTPDIALTSASSSRLLTGNFSICDELENELASLLGTEAALVFNSGYHANIGILPAICDNSTLILADKAVHASLIDGIRLSSPTRCIRYRHNDMAQLSRLVSQYHNVYSRLIIVTESIFSMDGDECPLDEIVSLKHAYKNILLYLDEAHAFGVRGPHGLGCAEEKGYIREIDFLVGTFGKAIASVGAFVACSHLVRNYLINRMRPFIFTTALPPINVAWTLHVIRNLAGMEVKRKHLAFLSRKLAAATKCPHSTHIIPWIIGENRSALFCAEALERHGFYALPIRPPTVPPHTARIRFSLTAGITEKEIDDLAEAIPQIANELIP